MLLTVERVLFLKKVRLFDNVDDNALVNLAVRMRQREYAAGEPIIQQGDSGRELFIIIHGSVRVTQGERVLNTLGSKSVFGEMAALDPQPRMATVTAIEETEVLTLDHRTLLEELATNNVLALGIIRFLIARLRDNR